jgi:L-ribulose-5-phosphate 3-epimerase
LPVNLLPPTNMKSRRDFLKASAALLSGAGLTSCMTQGTVDKATKPTFKISLAEWSLHKTLFAKQMENLDFPIAAKRDYGIEAVEFVNQFWKDKARDKSYLAELKKRCEGEGVRCVLIMCDGEGALGDANTDRRKKAVENHHQWVEAARYLGCHSIRVNAQSSGNYEEQIDRAADGLRQLSEFAGNLGMNVIVENHGGLSSNGQWLAAVMRKVNLPNCGTLPDFGNFRVSNTEEYDRYKGVTELMPFAKGVSAKSHDFDAQGNETHTDYRRMMKIVLDANYHGYVGVEYEGSKLSEPVGIRATKTLLERVRQELS